MSAPLHAGAPIEVAPAAVRPAHGAGAPRHAVDRGRVAPLATVARILAQLHADPRTIGLVMFLPLVFISLLYFVMIDLPTPPGQDPAFDQIGPTMLAVLPMMLMFLVTSIAMLRERTTGTLERLLTTPLSRWNLLSSYGLVFGLLGVAQASLLATFVLGVYGVDIEGPIWALLVVALLDALVGVSFGLLASAFARTEFQAVQFMPLFIGPQIFLCGLFAPVDHMPDALAAFARILPMTWAADAVLDITANAEVSSQTWVGIGLLAALVVGMLVLASASMPRQTR
ncbi:ABC transporter permease [Tessaracoccus sp. G1721]